MSRRRLALALVLALWPGIAPAQEVVARIDLSDQQMRVFEAGKGLIPQPSAFGGRRSWARQSASTYDLVRLSHCTRAWRCVMAAPASPVHRVRCYSR